MALFAVFNHYTDQAELVAKIRPQHRLFLGELLQQGTVAAYGPLGDASQGLVIVQAESANDAERLMDQDPLFREGLIADRTILEWTVANGPFGQ